MATIIAVYETVTKALKVTQDGKKIDDIQSVMFSSKYDKPGEFYFELSSYDVDEENDIHNMYRMMCEKYKKEDVVKKMQDYMAKKIK